MSTIAVIDHGVHGDRAVERRVLEPLGYEVIDTQDLGLTVEEAIYRLDGVAEVAVFGISHPRWVEAVAAVVVPKEGVTLTSEAVLEHSRSVLAPYKTPKYVVVAEALPKNPSGKILKRELRHRHADIAREE